MSDRAATPSLAQRPRVPTRTCVGCRTRRPRTEMVRLRRRSDGQVIPAGRHGRGRSAYLCPSRACYRTAVQRHSIERTLRGPRGLAVAVDAQRLWPSILDSVQQRIRVLRRSSAGSQSDRMTVLVALQQRLCESGEVIT